MRKVLDHVHAGIDDWVEECEGLAKLIEEGAVVRDRLDNAYVYYLRGRMISTPMVFCPCCGARIHAGYKPSKIVCVLYSDRCNVCGLVRSLCICDPISVKIGFEGDGKGNTEFDFVGDK